MTALSVAVETAARTAATSADYGIWGERVVVEAKDYGGQLRVGEWLAEAELERLNDDATVGMVVAKRKGKSNPGDQLVIMTLADLVALLTGQRLSEAG